MAMFTPTEKRNLTKLLASAANQEEVLSLDGLHGFLFGLAIIPEPIAPGEHLASIFGEEMLLLDEGKEGARLLGKLLAVSNRISQLNKDGELSFPFGDPIKPKDIPRAQDWTCGLYLAIGLRPGIWGMNYRVTAKGDERDGDAMNVSACYSVVMGICTPGKVTEYILQLAGESSQVEKDAAEFLARLFALLPKTVSALQKHGNDVRDGQKVLNVVKTAGPQQPLHVEKVGRNDQCPCGSGAKYKKCCGK